MYNALSLRLTSTPPYHPGLPRIGCIYVLAPARRAVLIDMAASHGSIVYSPHASCVLQTGEFVKIQRIKGQGYIFRIVNTCRYDDLPADVQVY